jgi:hypothetical protein
MGSARRPPRLDGRVADRTPMEAYDVFARDEFIAALEAHAEGEVVEPFDHAHC